MSDAALMTFAQEGDQLALVQLIDRHRDTVRRVCRRRLRKEDDVEDATQETIARFITRLSSLVPGDDIGRWLTRTAYHICIDVLRREESRSLPLTTASCPELSDPYEQIDTFHVLVTVLARATTRDVAIVLARHLAEAPVSEIAGVWGLSARAMAVELHRARKRLRASCCDGGVVP